MSFQKAALCTAPLFLSGNITANIHHLLMRVEQLCSGNIAAGGKRETHDESQRREMTKRKKAVESKQRQNCIFMQKAEVPYAGFEGFPA